MLKFLTKLMFQGLFVVLTLVAMTNIGTNSMFMMYQPVPPKKF